jgi:uridine kinase
MPLSLQQNALSRIQDVFLRDSQQDTPVVQFISLFFWENLTRWVHHVAFTPKPFTIALTGPSGSGKSFIREVLVNQLSQFTDVAAFTQDNYYRDFEADFHHLPLERFYDEINFDDPAHIRFKHLQQDLHRLRNQPIGSVLRLPRLRFGTPARKPAIIEEDLELQITPFVVTEGIHAFYDPGVLPYYDLKIYVDVEESTRRERWLARNKLENRGTTDNMWQTTVDCLRQHILPAQLAADLVINNNLPQEQVARFLEEVIQTLAAVSILSQREIA